MVEYPKSCPFWVSTFACSTFSNYRWNASTKVWRPISQNVKVKQVGPLMSLLTALWKIADSRTDVDLHACTYVVWLLVLLTLAVLHDSSNASCLPSTYTSTVVILSQIHGYSILHVCKFETFTSRHFCLTMQYPIAGSWKPEVRNEFDFTPVGHSGPFNCNCYTCIPTLLLLLALFWS